METTMKETGSKDLKPSAKNSKSLIFLGKKASTPKKYIRRKYKDNGLEGLLDLEIRLKS